jgi:threonine/homoserine/homoserine lactone efflux protein
MTSGIHDFTAFLIAGILLNLVPGNDTIYIISRTISQGKKAGLLSVLGIATGSLIHTTLAAFGLSLIIAKSIMVYTAMRYIGAAYLVYLGVKLLISKTSALTMLPVQQKPLRSIYYQGVLTNVLNPKVALFYISFLPQFIDPAYSKPYISFLLLGLTFTTTGTIWCMFLTMFATVISKILKKKRIVAGLVDKLCGLTLVGLGIKVALTKK